MTGPLGSILGSHLSPSIQLRCISLNPCSGAEPSPPRHMAWAAPQSREERPLARSPTCPSRLPSTLAISARTRLCLAPESGLGEGGPLLRPHSPRAGPLRLQGARHLRTPRGHGESAPFSHLRTPGPRVPPSARRGLGHASALPRPQMISSQRWRVCQAGEGWREAGGKQDRGGTERQRLAHTHPCARHREEKER